MSRLRSFALAVVALLPAAALAAPPGYVSPPNTYHYPSGSDFVSPANRTVTNYFAPPQSYYLHPYNTEPNVSPAHRTVTDYFAPPQSYSLHPYNAEPNVVPQYPPAPGTPPPGVTSPFDVPRPPRGMRETPARLPEPAEIEVRVPAGAEIWFNGEKTKQTGTRRLFSSPPLEPGNRYAYDVTARWTENGKTVEYTRHVPLTAGSREQVTFRE